MTTKYRFATQVIHSGQTPQSWEGATLPPIFQAASHAHPTAESLSRSSRLPYQWHDTPNIRVITIKDFQRFSREVGFEIARWTAIKTDPREQRGLMVSCWPNLRAAYGIFQIQK